MQATNTIETTETKEIIKYVNRADSADVNRALDAEIDIDSDYVFDDCNLLIASIVATNGYHSSRRVDKIKISVKQPRNTIIAGAGIYMADKVLYYAPEVMYLRHFGCFAVGGGVTCGINDYRQIIGIKILGSYTF